MNGRLSHRIIDSARCCWGILGDVGGFMAVFLSRLWTVGLSAVSCLTHSDLVGPQIASFPVNVQRFPAANCKTACYGSFMQSTSFVSNVVCSLFYLRFFPLNVWNRFSSSTVHVFVLHVITVWYNWITETGTRSRLFLFDIRDKVWLHMPPARLQFPHTLSTFYTAVCFHNIPLWNFYSFRMNFVSVAHRKWPCELRVHL